MEPSETKNARSKRSSPSETKHDKFERLAGRRMEAIKSQLKLLSNLSNFYHYDYEPAEVEQIFNEIYRQVRAARVRFDSAFALRSKSKLGE